MALIIGIAGGSASGKTFIVTKVRSAILEESEHICQDWFLKEYFKIPKVNGLRNFDHPESFEWNLLEKAILKLKNNQECKIPVYEYSKGRTGFRKISPKPIVFFEGLHAFYTDKISQALDLKFFVDAPEKERLKRRLCRDKERCSESEGEIMQRFLQQVKPMHEIYVQPCKSNAEFVLDGLDENSFKHVVERIAKMAKAERNT